MKAKDRAVCSCNATPFPHWHTEDGFVIALYNPNAKVGIVVMPSQAAMKAADEVIEQIDDGFNLQEEVAPVIDAHFAPYLAAVEALRESVGQPCDLTNALCHYKLIKGDGSYMTADECGRCGRLLRAWSALAAIDKLEGKR